MDAIEFKTKAIKAGSRNGWHLMAVFPILKKAVFQKSENEFCYTTIDRENQSCVWGHYGYSSVEEAIQAVINGEEE